MKILSDFLCNLSRLLMVVTFTLVSSFGVTMAGDITQYANKTWLRAGFIWGTTEIVGCRPADPDGLSCATDIYSEAADDPPWTFEAGPGGVLLTVVDGYVYGEQFAVYDNGEYIGVTSEAPYQTGECLNSPENCLSSEASKGFFDLEAGPHSITMEETTGLFMTGVLWFRVVGDFLGVEEEIAIDIQPNKTDNKLRLDDSSVIPVAILSTEDFDARLVDPNSVQFGPAGALPIERMTRFRDVNGDGFVDHYFRFSAVESGIQCDDTEATLTGTWVSLENEEVPVIGTDSFTVRQCML